jgi:hypothetical protein
MALQEAHSMAPSKQAQQCMVAQDGQRARQGQTQTQDKDSTAQSQFFQGTLFLEQVTQHSFGPFCHTQATGACWVAEGHSCRACCKVNKPM